MRKTAFAIAILITLFFYFIDSYMSHQNKTAYVEKVIDGDTIKTNIGTIRLLGINAPEIGEAYYQEAKDFLKQMIERKNITIEGKETDRYGRLLRYIYFKNIFVNLELVKRGYAHIYTHKGIKHELLVAEQTAKQNNIGIWKKGNYSKCFYVSEFVWDAYGDDNKNLNGEYFTLKNKCKPININSWTIKDRNRIIYTFSNFVANSTLTVYTGCGNNTKEKVYMCRKKPAWNNDEDILFIRDENSKLVLSYNY